MLHVNAPLLVTKNVIPFPPSIYYFKVIMLLSISFINDRYQLKTLLSIFQIIRTLNS
jgi:hypothetical protein